MYVELQIMCCNFSPVSFRYSFYEMCHLFAFVSFVLFLLFFSPFQSLYLLFCGYYSYLNLEEEVVCQVEEANLSYGKNAQITQQKLLMLWYLTIAAQLEVSFILLPSSL